LIKPGVYVSGDDIIIGKVAKTSEITQEGGIYSQRKFKDCSVPLKHTENGIIDQVIITTNDEN
jgi:DNA-directed RNA polymerase II subunit RPB2